MRIKPTSWGPPLVITSMLGAFSPGALAQIVSNGGFEIPLVAPGSATYTAGQSFGGWTVDLGNISLNNECCTGNSFSGLQSAYLSGTFHQDLNTLVGAQYALSYARGCSCDAIHHHEVLLSWGTESVTNRFTELGWGRSSYIFVAADVTTRLSFTGMDILLDDVLLSQWHRLHSQP